MMTCLARVLFMAVVLAASGCIQLQARSELPEQRALPPGCRNAS